MLTVSEQIVAKPRALYQLKITLQDIQPLIWRRVEVWEDITLGQLHTLLQIVMDWEDCHMHDFIVGHNHYGAPDPDDDRHEREVLDEKFAQLNNVVQCAGGGFQYIYDFGDDWRHDLVLEAILLPEDNINYPRCVSGKRRTPPKDVGGPPGYQNYLAAIVDPNHREHKSMLAWRGSFNLGTFSAAAVNRRLQKKFRATDSVLPRSSIH